MSEASFGHTLKRERERRGISLESVARKTKISASLFVDLERDNLSRWPTGIFRRAFIKAYAEAIGLSPRRTLIEFLEIFPEGATTPVSPHNIGSSENGGGFQHRLRLTLAEPTEAARLDFTVERRGGSARRRLWPVAIDAGTVLAAALLGVLVGGWGHFWVAVAVGGLAYHLTSSLVIGTTLGAWLVTLQRSASRWQPAHSRTIPFRRPRPNYHIVNRLYVAGRRHRRHA